MTKVDIIILIYSRGQIWVFFYYIKYILTQGNHKDHIFSLMIFWWKFVIQYWFDLMPLLKCSPLIVRLWMPGLDQESSHLWKSRTTRVPAAASTSPPSSPRRCTPTAFPAPSTTCQVLQYKNNHSHPHPLHLAARCLTSTSWMNRQ